MTKRRAAMTVIKRDVIDFVIDEALAASRGEQRRTARVREAQKTLRGLVDAGAWKAYLDLENRVNDRAEKQMRVVVKRVFTIYVRARP